MEKSVATSTAINANKNRAVTATTDNGKAQETDDYKQVSFNMEDNIGPKKFYPYKLLIVIYSAQNLAVADITTSDPYVIVYVAEKFIGRTKTIYKNHINPFWNEAFPVGLLHVNSVLHLRLFDEDANTDDDLMGVVNIDISELPINTMLRKSYPIEQAGKLKAKGSLEIGLLLGRNSSVVSIISDEDDMEEKKDTLAAPFEIIPMIKRELQLENTLEAVERTLYRFYADDLKAKYFHKDVVRDLLHDVDSMLHVENNERPQLMDGLARSKLKLISSTMITMETKECISHPPIEDNCLLINLDCGGNKFVLLKLPNRFSVWSWVRWLQLLYDEWTGKVSTAKRPSWALQGVCLSMMTIITSEGQTIHGVGSVNGENTFKIRCDGKSIDFHSMVSIVTSLDSLEPLEYSLEVEITRDCDVLAEEMAQRDSSTDRDTPSELGMKKKSSNVFGKAFRKIRKGVKGTAENVGNVAIGATGFAFDTALGVATTTVGAARTVASGDVGAVLSAAQGTVVGVGLGVTQGVANVVQGRLGSNTFFVFKNGRMLAQNSKLIDSHTQEPFHDYLLLDASANDLTNNRSKGFTITASHGAYGSESIIGQKYVKFSKLFAREADLRSPMFLINSLDVPHYSKISVTNRIGNETIR